MVHDLSVAKVYGTRALLLSQGESRAFGDPSKVLTPELLEEIYGMDVYGWMRGLLAHWK